MRLLIGFTVVLFVAMVAAGITSDGPGERSGSPAGGAYDTHTVARAAAMTQQMSGDRPLSGHEYHSHAGDEQLRLASNAQFVRALEAYQAQIDRMLARNQ